MEERVITSLNAIAWLKSHGVEVNEKYEFGFYFVTVKDTEEVNDLMQRYYDDKELHSFLNEFKNIKKNMRGVR